MSYEYPPTSPSEKTMRVPSGDQMGWWTNPPRNVKRLNTARVKSCSHTSPTVDKPGPILIASVFPSGDTEYGF